MTASCDRARRGARSVNTVSGGSELDILSKLALKEEHLNMGKSDLEGIQSCLCCPDDFGV